MDDVAERNPTAFWEAMQDGNVFYRRQQVYSIPGKLPNLSDYIITGCLYGGPLGIHATVFDCHHTHHVHSFDARFVEAHRVEWGNRTFRKSADTRVFSRRGSHVNI